MAFFDDDDLQNGQLGGPTATPPAPPGAVSQDTPMPPPQAMPMPPQGQLGGQPVPPPPSQPSPLVVSGGAAPNAIRMTPAQEVIGGMNRANAEKTNVEQEGDIRSDAAKEAEEINKKAAAEQLQKKLDSAAFIQKADNEGHSVIAAAQAEHNKFRDAAGTLKDPSEGFWADKSGGAKLGAVLAGALSGFGTGFATKGQGGNPFMDYLNKRIQGNYEAHKQNMEDLYKSSVDAGKIVDTVENHNKFMANYHLASDKIGSEQTKYELDALANKTTGKMVPIVVARAKADLDRQIDQSRAALSHSEAAQAAAQAALQRARQKEIREFYQKQLELHKDLPEDQMRIEAAKDTAGVFNRSEVSPIMDSIGVTYNDKDPDINKRGWSYPAPKASTNTSQEATLDENGNLVEPTLDAQGRRIKPEDSAKREEADRKRIVKVDGEPTLAKNEESAKAYDIHSNAHNTLVGLVKDARAAWNSGDQGTYEALKKRITEISPEEYGYKRGPSVSNSGENANAERDAGTIAGQLPDWEKHTLGIQAQDALTHKILPNVPLFGKNSEEGKALSKFDSLDKFLVQHHQDMIDNNLARPDKKPQAAPDPSKDPFGKVISPGK
jgi:hypothetical protein